MLRSKNSTQKLFSARTHYLNLSAQFQLSAKLIRFKGCSDSLCICRLSSLTWFGLLGVNLTAVVVRTLDNVAPFSETNKNEMKLHRCSLIRSDNDSRFKTDYNIFTRHLTTCSTCLPCVSPISFMLIRSELTMCNAA